MPALPTLLPVELPAPLSGVDVIVPGPWRTPVSVRDGPRRPLSDVGRAPALLPPGSRRRRSAASPFASADADEAHGRQSAAGRTRVSPAAQRPAPATVPTQRVAAGAAASAAAGAGAGAAGVALIFAILAAYALVPPGGFRRLRRVRVRTPSGVDGGVATAPGSHAFVQSGARPGMYPRRRSV